MEQFTLFKKIIAVFLFVLVLSAVVSDAKMFSPAYEPQQCVKLTASTKISTALGTCLGGTVYIAQDYIDTPTDFRYYVISLEKNCPNRAFYVQETQIVGTTPCGEGEMR